MRIYWLDLFEKGNVAMSAAPKGNDWLEEEIKYLALRGITILVSLLEKSEIRELNLEEEKDMCEQNNIEFINFPIKDRQVPESKIQFSNLLQNIENALIENKKVLVHCRMGIGRTSLVCAGVLLKQGIKTKEVFDILSEKRTLKMPDTPIQKEWIEELFLL